MKNIPIKIFAFVFVFIMIFVGCATMPNLIGTDDYSLETVPHLRADFGQVRAVDDDGKFKVFGELSTAGIPGLDAPGYVKINLINRAGTIIESRKVMTYPIILNGHRRIREVKFTAQFNNRPPPGTVIRLSNVN